MTDVIKDNKYVELNYQVIDEKSGQVLTEVEFPLGYVHGVNEVLSPKVMGELEGKAQGETIEVPIDCNALYGPRDESLVITEAIENVPEEYRELGTAILMENDRGQTKNFLVTRLDDKTITIDGNNPLCGRQVIFKLNVLLVRDATADEIEHGGKVESGPEIDSGRAVPIE
ncbi:MULTISPECIES: peptidylprolyl isomerase [unclassified Thioalkalivibrio]|uniref:FKBP-type peptidyl-prolyl cis-trans isomerase n=1 Tax=unclassified Thioalkalivibrio TaxID=2621013 RepID=UPI0003781829|nr:MULTISPECIES: peptidyl-prolyl cis-trans isomerase [unclassified Thioalkalivibrio]